MRAGLLMCDHVAAEYQPEYGDYSDMFIQLFPDFEWKLYDCINGKFPEDLDECEVYFATGSKHSVYDDLKWITKLKSVIKELYSNEKSFIGFCFGHQLIGEALGGKVGKSPNGWCVGVHHFEIQYQEVWMTPINENINLLMMCQDQILILPDDTKVLASNSKCPNAIIRVGKRFLGIQAHPEFSKAYDELLMKTRMNRMGDEVANEGIKSLAQKVDNQLIKSWVMNFLNQTI